MKSLVIDASVIIKWLLPDRAEEGHLQQALFLLGLIRQGAVKVLQPPHWLAESAAVIVRLQPKIAGESIDLLYALEFPTINVPEIYSIACHLSKQLGHHLFDTLYHAVAIYNGNAEFVTADEQYYKKAYKHGSILRLADYPIFNN